MLARLCAVAGIPAAAAAPLEIFTAFIDQRDVYLPGLQALAMSLISSNNTRPFVVMTDGKPTSALLHTAACLNLSVFHAWGHDNPHKDNRFGETYSKLLAFSLPASRVVLLDVDMVVLRNLDALFGPGPELQAVPDVDTTMTFNSGLLVVRPSETLAAHVAYGTGLRLVSHPEMDDGSEQGFLNRMFLYYWEKTKEAKLPMEFNTVKRLEIHPEWYIRKFDLRWVRVLHFVGDKPWQEKESNDNEQHPQSLGVYRAAKRAYDDRCANCFFDALCARDGPMYGSFTPYPC